jgi:hypothetical protein
MKPVAQRTADHRRLVAAGIGVSAAVHVALFAWITLPVTPLEGDDRETARRSSDALELISVRVPEPAPALPVSASAVDVGRAGGGSQGASAAAPESSPASAPARDLASAVATRPATPAVERLDVAAPLALGEGIRIGQLGEISAVEPMPVAGHAGHVHDHDHGDGPGFWDRLFGGADITVQRGGICPIDGQPLWGGGGAPGPGYSIPNVRDGGLGLPAGGKIGLPGRGSRGGFGGPAIGGRGPVIIRR